MNQEQTYTPVINTFSKFKETYRKTELISAYSGGRQKVFELLYGFNGSHYIHETNAKKAFEKYKDSAIYLDKYIPESSFLRQK